MMKYWAFISYCHRDENWARWLHRAIEGYRVPGRLVGRSTRNGVVPTRLYPVFRDRDELPTSANLGESLLNALKQSRFLIVICSPEAAASRWVNEEVRAFKALGREDRVLCLVVEGEPNASDRRDSVQQECFPPAVRYRVSAEGLLGQERSESLAADARPGKDGRLDVKLKLLAGLLGVGLDELKQREKERQRAGLSLGLLFTGLFAALLLLPNGLILPLRSLVFDAYHRAAPRIPASQPVTIVEIDQKSLAAIGRWPWPRTVMAELVDRINAQRPAAIGIDLLMPEADALSPERLLGRVRPGDTALAEALSGRPTNDAVLARALTAANAVLAVAGTSGPTGMALRAPPFTVRDSRERDASGTYAALKVARYAGVLTSIDELDRAASGHGLISVEPEGGVIRRIPLVASIDDKLVPALAIEMLRAAIGAPSVRLHVSGSRVEDVATGDFVVPTEADGAVRVYYSLRNAVRFVSAVDVLDGKVDPARLAQKLVLIGVTGLGLLEYANTPVGERMPGSEIHAQLLENLYDGTLLHRPDWAPWLETAVFLLLGGWLVFATFRWKPHNVALLMAVGVVLPAAIAFIAFRAQRTLFDAATPAVGLMLLFGLLMSYAFFSTSARLPGPGAIDP